MASGTRAEAIGQASILKQREDITYLPGKKPYAPSNSTMPSAPSAPKNTIAEERTTPESLLLVEQNINYTAPEDPQPKQLVREENRVFSDSCGGIIKISINENETEYIVGDFEPCEHCAWIINSDMKKVRVQYAIESLGVQSGTVIGEVDAEDEGLSCSKLMFSVKVFICRTSSRICRNSASTRILTPVDDSGSHASKPLTYHVHRKMNGTLPLSLTPTRSESFLGLIAVFQSQKPNGFGRDFICSPTGPNQCCDYVAAYAMDDFKSGGSCRKISTLNSSNGTASYGGTMVALYWSHWVRTESECQMTWSENSEMYLSHVSY